MALLLLRRLCVVDAGDNARSLHLGTAGRLLLHTAAAPADAAAPLPVLCRRLLPAAAEKLDRLCFLGRDSDEAAAAVVSAPLRFPVCTATPTDGRQTVLSSREVGAQPLSRCSTADPFPSHLPRRALLPVCPIRCAANSQAHLT